MVFRPAAETRQHVMKQPQPRPRRVGIVQPRYLARRRAADHVGIVRLPAPVIALAHERRPDRVPHSRPEAPRVLVKIPRVLVKDRLQEQFVVRRFTTHTRKLAGMFRKVLAEGTVAPLVSVGGLSAGPMTFVLARDRKSAV